MNCSDIDKFKKGFLNRHIERLNDKILYNLTEQLKESNPDESDELIRLFILNYIKCDYGLTDDNRLIVYPDFKSIDEIDFNSHHMKLLKDLMLEELYLSNY